MSWLRWFRRAPEPSALLSKALAEGNARATRERRLAEENVFLRDQLAVNRLIEQEKHDSFMSFAEEMVEARMMAGAGPGSSVPTQAQEAVLAIKERSLGVRESYPISAQGAFGDIELALQNVDWRREINISWLEFSRWGIQQIILISRLYYIKNPLIQRAINVAATYVFGRGMEITTEDDDANDVIQDFLDRNQTVFGQTGLLDSERRKYYDGNLFWAFFVDANADGKVSVRSMDATEVQEVVCDPDDTDVPWLYRRCWVERVFDMNSGTVQTNSREEYYPALDWDPPQKPATIGGHPVNWDVRVYHRRCGGVAKWHFGCPIIYAALDWAKQARRMLEACATIRQSLAQISMTLTTKGGQAALAAAKGQLQTAVNAQPGNSLWDSNPTAVNASIFGSGPGTVLEAFKTQGAGGNPDDVRQYKAMVAIVVGIPPTWLGDLETSNLATATTLDRPTELGFLEKQEQWVEDATKMIKSVLDAAKKAPNGKLRESKLVVMGAPRKTMNGQRVYDEAAAKKAGGIQIRVNFPAIREGDLPQLIASIVAAMTLDNKGGQVIGIDEKEGVRLLFDALGANFEIADKEAILEAMYPSTGDTKYDPDRTVEPLPAPIGKALPLPGGQPQNPQGQQPGATGVQGAPGSQTAPVPMVGTEALARLYEAVRKYRESRAA